MKQTIGHKVNLFVEAEMAGGTDQGTIAKALKAKAAELEKAAKPAQDPAPPQEPAKK